MNDYKEYLEKQQDGTYALVLRGDLCKESDILIPEGAEVATACGLAVYFWKPSENKTFIDNVGWSECDEKSICTLDSYLEDADVSIIWKRDQDEPFLTPECTLNDQYAEIEQVRQAIKDNVNHPSHYAGSAIECIDAMEAMMTHEQFIGYLRGNLFKYQWRYEKKNGIEDLKKAQWYLEKLTVKVAEKNAPF